MNTKKWNKKLIHDQCPCHQRWIMAWWPGSIATLPVRHQGIISCVPCPPSPTTTTAHNPPRDTPPHTHTHTNKQTNKQKQTNIVNCKLQDCWEEQSSPSVVLWEHPYARFPRGWATSLTCHSMKVNRVGLPGFLGSRTNSLRPLSGHKHKSKRYCNCNCKAMRLWPGPG